jgi:hypothetical protein
MESVGFVGGTESVARAVAVREDEGDERGENDDDRDHGRKRAKGKHAGGG